MQLPYSRALHWLFLEGKTVQEIREQLDEISLPPLEAPDMEAIHEVAKNIPMSPGMQRRLQAKKYDRQDLIVAERLGFAEIYCKHVNNYEYYPKAQLLWEEISQILRNPVLRIAIDVGILCKYTLDELAQVLPATYHEKLSEDGIELYCKYFFDYKNMSKGDWRVYLRISSAIPYAYIRYHAALTKPRDEALFLAGLPTRANFSDFLKTVMGTAAYKFQYYSRMQTQQADGQARQWAKVGFDAGVRYEKFSAGEVTDFAAKIQTEFDYIDTGIETIAPDLLTQVKPPEEPKGAGTDLAAPPPLIQPELEV